MNRHLTNDELLDRLYGICLSDAESHVLECPDCANRYRAFEERRTKTAAEPAISRDTLAAQRRAIYGRIDAARETPTGWAPALAAGVLLVAGMFLYRPLIRIADRPAPAALTEISDEQLFTEVYSIVDSAEPLAAAPIQGLFEGSEEGQP